jgi:hypothetical protein
VFGLVDRPIRTDIGVQVHKVKEMLINVSIYCGVIWADSLDFGVNIIPKFTTGTLEELL